MKSLKSRVAALAVTVGIAGGVLAAPAFAATADIVCGA